MDIATVCGECGCPIAKKIFTNDYNPCPLKKWEEVDAEYAYQEKLAKHYQYSYDRCKEYPDGFEQLDMLWHAINNNIELKDSEWFKKIKEVKEKYPKPTEPVPTKD